MTDKECSCLERGPRQGDISEETDIGTDYTNGRYASVELNRCRKCGRLWLHYHVEYEGFSKSGRWATCPIDEKSAADMKPDEAAEFIDRQPWYIYGGCYWNHTDKRGAGPLRWD